MSMAALIVKLRTFALEFCPSNHGGMGQNRLETLQRGYEDPATRCSPAYIHIIIYIYNYTIYVCVCFFLCLVISLGGQRMLHCLGREEQQIRRRHGAEEVQGGIREGGASQNQGICWRRWQVSQLFFLVLCLCCVHLEKLYQYVHNTMYSNAQVFLFFLITLLLCVCSSLL